MASHAKVVHRRAQRESFTAPAGFWFSGAAAAVGDRVYAATVGFSLGSSSAMYALDETTGAVVWQTPLMGGSNASVAVAGGRVLVHAENQHRLYALNAATGGTVWSTPLSPGTGASSLSSPAAAFGRVFVGSDDGLFALERGTRRASSSSCSSCRTKDMFTHSAEVRMRFVPSPDGQRLLINT